MGLQEAGGEENVESAHWSAWLDACTDANIHRNQGASESLG